MSKDKFTTEENRMLTEIYRRLNYFHKGNVNEPFMLLEMPSRAKCLVNISLIEPTCRETPKVLNWYKLTESGKKFFSNYISIINDDTNTKLFNGEIETFDKKLLP